MGLKELSERLEQAAEKQRAKAERLKVESAAAKINGRPWWESDLPQYVATYKSVADVNAEIPYAAERGWAIQAVSSTDGHINVGRTAARVAVTGRMGLLMGASRTSGTTTVIWSRITH
jgi:hypothetical protein